MIFILKPWNEVNKKQIVRVPKKKENGSTFKPFQELRVRLENWVKHIFLSRSIIFSAGRYSKRRYWWIAWRSSNERAISSYVYSIIILFDCLGELNAQETLDFLRQFNLKAENNPKFPKIMEYRYYRPGQVIPNVQPKHPGVEVHSMYKRFFLKIWHSFLVPKLIKTGSIRLLGEVNGQNRTRAPTMLRLW